MNAERRGPTMSTTTDLPRRLETFLAMVDREHVVEHVVRATASERSEVRRKLDLYLNETWVGLDLVSPHLDDAERILELGAGIGAFSGFLSTLGHDVVALEPAGPGFELLDAFRRALDEQWPDVRREILPIPAEALSDEQGPFDLAFSVHVMEHVDDVESALRVTHARLRDGGRSVHVCPNYSFPYDPHFGIPLLPVRPDLTRRLLPQRITESGMWASLNFINARRVTTIADELGLKVAFRPGAFAEMADRVRRDPTFRARHGAVGRIAQGMTELDLGRRLLEWWPAHLASPMVFELTARDPASIAA